jgi:hypothetical protein
MTGDSAFVVALASFAKKRGLEGHAPRLFASPKVIRQ